MFCAMATWVYLVVCYPSSLQIIPLRKPFVVVTDRFYTSVGLAIALVKRGMHLVGTILTDKRGVSPKLVWTSDMKLPRWTATFMRHWRYPRLLLQSWQDRGQVHMYVSHQPLVRASSVAHSGLHSCGVALSSLSTAFQGVRWVGSTLARLVHREGVPVPRARLSYAALGAVVGGVFSGLGATPVLATAVGAGAMGGAAVLAHRLPRVIKTEHSTSTYETAQAPVPPAALAFNFGYKG